MVGTQMDVVFLSLQTIERIGYHVPVWSWMKMQALMQYSVDVQLISESHATIVIGMWYVVYDIIVVFIYSYYYMSTF